jgi:hypothetical protein
MSLTEEEKRRVIEMLEERENEHRPVVNVVHFNDNRGKEVENKNFDFKLFLKKTSMSVLVGITSAMILAMLGITGFEVVSISVVVGIVTISVYVLSS